MGRDGRSIPPSSCADDAGAQAFYEWYRFATCSTRPVVIAGDGILRPICGTGFARFAPRPLCGCHGWNRPVVFFHFPETAFIGSAAPPIAQAFAQELR